MPALPFSALMTSLLLTSGQPADPVPGPTPPPATAPTLGEQITRLRDTIKSGRAAITKMQQRLDAPDGEYHKAEAEFQAANQSLKAGQAAVAALVAEGKAAEAATAEQALAATREEWKAARDRFDLAINYRKASQEALAALGQRIEQEQKQLDRLEGKALPAPANPPAPPAPAVPAPTEKPAPVPAGPVGLPALPGLPAPAPAALPPAPPPQPDDEEVKEARQELDARRQAQLAAEENARTIGERVAALRQSIAAANKVLAADRAAADLTQQSLAQLTGQLQTKPPADEAERKKLADRIADASQRLFDARARIGKLSAKIAALNEELHALEQEQIHALQEADRRKAEAEDAGETLARAVNPFSVRGFVRWVTDHGPNLFVILTVTAVLYLIVRLFSRQFVRAVTRTSHRGTEEDRENRASTLVGVFRYAAGLLVLGGGAVMVLEEAGIPIVPLMGGAAVLGLAVAFGAQNLIKDYFSGFMMLTEDQYGVNDVVRIGATAGLVEKITLRVTVLRDLEGIRHFIPHGSVTQVSNMTHTWSRAMFDVRVAYGEDVDRAIDVLMGLAREMRSDAELGPYIIEDPEMLGVDDLDASSVVIKFLIKTRPIKQWLVKREMLRRIKNRFDQLGIVIPFPHQTVYHRFPEGVPTAPPG